MPTRLPFPGVRLLRRLLLIFALLVPGTIPASAARAQPTLILAPGSGAYGPGCAGRLMALGDGFPEGAGIALFALKAPGAPFTVANIRTLLATVAVQDGRFVGGYVGLDALLCAERGGDPAAYPDGSRIEIVAAIGTDVGEPFPRAGTELARATFTVDRERALPTSQRCFAETLLCVQGRFFAYWQEHGGLARNGFPLTAERTELLEDGREYTVQYFERVRLEYHPENPPPYDVLLGQFGRRVARGVACREEPIAVQRFFPETGHNLGGRFLDYWEANGGLAQFGLPISGEIGAELASQQIFMVQYFERARFEYHPENADPQYQVLLGQFGRQILAENALLAGDFGALYLGNERVRNQLGPPRAPGETVPGATQGFERGRMISFGRPFYDAQFGFYGHDRRIYVLCGGETAGQLLQSYPPDAPFFPDTWAEGQDPGGGPVPAPGLFLPQRGCGKVWREGRGVRDCLGYATAPPEVATILTVQPFTDGLLVSSAGDGGAIYAFFISWTNKVALWMRQNWDDGYCRQVPRAACNQPDRRSSGGQLGHDGHPVLLKPASALRQRDGFA